MIFLRKHVYIISTILVILLSLCLLYSYHKSQAEEPISISEIEVYLNENYKILTDIASLVHGKNGYFYAQYIDGKLNISTNMQELLSGKEIKGEIVKQVDYVINNLGFIGIYKDKQKDVVIFEKKNNGGGSGLIYSINVTPESEYVELLRDNWFYYYWFGE